MTVGPPPQAFDPSFETLDAGTLFHRVHEPVFPDGSDNDGTAFNPGFGRPTRFAFFGAPPVPVLYAADKPEGAVHETILHDAEPGGYVPGVQWRTKVLTTLELTRDVRVACFHSHGLRRLGTYARDLTDTDLRSYGVTVQWAAAAWAAGAEGIAYMCRHFNSAKAVCLFGDRVRTSDLRPLPDHRETRAFAVPRDAEWLAGVARDMRVTIRPR